MAIYSDLTNEQLTAEIAAFRTARRNIILGGDGGVGAVKRVSDGDRTIEYTSANLAALDTELKTLLAEQNRRNGRGFGNAIEVEFS